MENEDVINCNGLDKMVAAGIPSGMDPWEYLDLTPLQFCQYLLYAQVQVGVNRAALYSALEKSDPEHWADNKAFADDIFSVGSK